MMFMARLVKAANMDTVASLQCVIDILANGRYG